MSEQQQPVEMDYRMYVLIRDFIHDFVWNRQDKDDEKETPNEE